MWRSGWSSAARSGLAAARYTHNIMTGGPPNKQYYSDGTTPYCHTTKAHKRVDTSETVAKVSKSLRAAAARLRERRFKTFQ